MVTNVVDLNADVQAIRRLRAAAVVPRFVSVCCFLSALFLFALQVTGWKGAGYLFCVAGLLALLARYTEHGARWAVWLLTTLLLATTAVMVWTISAESQSTVERLQVAGGSVLMLMPCWILVSRAWRAAQRKGAVSAVRALSRGAWSRTPRQERSREAMESFTTAAIIYVVGVIPAALAGLVVGWHLFMLGASLVYWPIARLAGQIWDRGRRQSALRLQEVRKRDPRPPVLLLRSFGDDNLPLEKRYHMFWHLFSARELVTLEGFIANQIWRLGPVLAIGNPSEGLSPLGAAREYVSEDRWRGLIQQYLCESEYVVSVLGSTPGLSWEYEQMQALRKEIRLLIVFPPRPAKELRRRWRVLQDLVKRAKIVDLQWRPFIGVPLLAFFAQDAVHLFYCKFCNETAYLAAFARLFEAIGGPTC